MNEQPTYRRFTIKNLLVTMAFFAVALGWWVDRSRLVEQLNYDRTDVNRDGTITSADALAVINRLNR